MQVFLPSLFPPSSPALADPYLPYSYVIHVHALRHRRIVDAFLARPLATDGEVEDQLEPLVERPFGLAVGRLPVDAQDAAAVDADGDRVRPPVELIAMVGGATRRNRPLRALLGPDG